MLTKPISEMNRKKMTSFCSKFKGETIEYSSQGHFREGIFLPRPENLCKDLRLSSISSKRDAFTGNLRLCKSSENIYDEKCQAANDFGNLRRSYSLSPGFKSNPFLFKHSCFQDCIILNANDRSAMCIENNKKCFKNLVKSRDYCENDILINNFMENDNHLQKMEIDEIIEGNISKMPNLADIISLTSDSVGYSINYSSKKLYEGSVISMLDNHTDVPEGKLSKIITGNINEINLPIDEKLSINTAEFSINYKNEILFNSCYSYIVSNYNDLMETKVSRRITDDTYKGSFSVASNEKIHSIMYLRKCTNPCELSSDIKSCRNDLRKLKLSQPMKDDVFKVPIPAIQNENTKKSVVLKITFLSTSIQTSDKNSRKSYYYANAHLKNPPRQFFNSCANLNSVGFKALCNSYSDVLYENKKIFLENGNNADNSFFVGKPLLVKKCIKEIIYNQNSSLLNNIPCIFSNKCLEEERSNIFWGYRGKCSKLRICNFVQKFLGTASSSLNNKCIDEMINSYFASKYLFQLDLTHLNEFAWKPDQNSAILNSSKSYLAGMNNISDLHSHSPIKAELLNLNFQLQFLHSLYCNNLIDFDDIFSKNPSSDFLISKSALTQGSHLNYLFVFDIVFYSEKPDEYVFDAQMYEDNFVKASKKQRNYSTSSKALSDLVDAFNLISLLSNKKWWIYVYKNLDTLEEHGMHVDASKVRKYFKYFH